MEIVTAEILETPSRKLTELLTVVTELLTVVIFVVFVTPELLTVLKLLLIVLTLLLVVTRELLTVVSADVTGRFVRRDPSPTKRLKTIPAEIVEKNP